MNTCRQLLAGLCWLCAFLLLMPQSLPAQTWDGGGINDNWSTAANWNPDGVPLTNGLGQVTFGGTTRLTPFVDMPWNIFTINFNNTAGPFVIGGNLLGNVSAITNSSANLQTFNNPVTMGFSSTINAASGPLLLGGSVDLSSQNVSVTGAGNTQINGILSGAGRLAKNGTGSLTLAGASGNTFSGETTVNAGTLILSKPTGIVSNNFGSALAGPLIINAGATVRLGGESQIPDNQPLTIGGTLDLNGFAEGIAAPVTLNGGSIVTGTGLFHLFSDMTSNANAAAATISGNLTLRGGTRIFNVGEGSAQHDLDVSAVVSDGAIVKEGAGTLRLSAANNTFAGGVTLNAGTLMLREIQSAGTGNIRINGGTISSDFFAVGTNSHVVIANSFTALGHLQLLRGATLASSPVINIPQFLTIPNVIGEDAPGRGLTKTGAGRLTFSGAGNNTYSGATTINEGTLRLSKSGIAIAGPLVIGDGTGSDLVELTASNQIADSSQVTVNSSGQLNVNAFSDTIGGLTMTGGTVLGSGQLTVGTTTTGGTLSYGNGAATTATIAANTSLVGQAFFNFTMNVADGSAPVDLEMSGIVNSSGLIKSGPGTLVFSGAAANVLPYFYMDDGTVVVRKTAGVALGGPLGDVSIDGSAAGAAGSTLRLEASNQISPETRVVVMDNARLDLNGFNQTVGELQLYAGGSISTGAGVLTLNGSETWLDPLTISRTSTISGRIDFEGNGHSFNTADEPALPIELDISATISNGLLGKTGPGTMKLGGTAPNSDIFATFVDEGTLLLAKPASTLAIPGDLVIEPRPNPSAPAIVRLLAAEQVSDAHDVLVTGGTLDLNGFSETVNKFEMTSAAVAGGGTLRTMGLFTYHSGTFDARLHAHANAVFNSNFTAGNGLVSLGSFSIGAGRTITLNGAGLDNQGTITLTGGTLTGTGPLLNNGGIAGFGTIAGGGGFINNGILTQSGVLLLSNTGPNSNFGNIDVANGQQLQLTGASLSNAGSIDLNDGIISGTGTLTNTFGGVIRGRGIISAAFANNGGLLLLELGTTRINTAFANSGTIELKGAGASLTGGQINNTGNIQGFGSVGNAINNAGRITASGGNLLLSGAVGNSAAGLLSAATGSQLTFARGLETNSGIINLLGGVFENSGIALDNSGQISGFGTLRTGGLTNNGTITFTGGFTTINGNVINAAGKQLRVAYNPALFTGNVTNNGIFKNTETTITFAGTYTENGTYISDPADNFFSDVSIGDVGAWVGGWGDRFFVSGDLKSTSKAALSWQTNAAELHLIGGVDHILSIAGEDRGVSFDGYVDNFAWGALIIGGGDSVILEDANSDTGGAIYVHKLLLAGGVDQISSIQSNGLNIYYDLGDSSNGYLGGKSYSLAGGGTLSAVPEPAIAWLLFVGAAIAMRRRR